jgi:mono/diheme cytochrome c family protein
MVIKALALPLLGLVLACSGTSGRSEKEQVGQQAFEKYCVSCHGNDGKKSLAGAADLSQSTLSNRETEAIIRQGQGNMPAFGGFLDDSTLTDLVTYLQELKTHD